MYGRAVQRWMIDVLSRLAEMPFHRQTFLFWGHTVPAGKPVTPAPSELTSLFILPPYMEDPSFSPLEISGERVDFHWVVPITETERLYAVKNGGQALGDIIADHDQSEVLDETRRSFV
jgi:hypothetical protein